jgi:glycine oxidase
MSQDSPQGPHGSGRSIAIIGGGIIGLSIGWRLAAAGLAVTVFERGQVGRGATWAAAGMLAAGSEVEPGEQALDALLLQSQAMWPDFAAELRAATGIDVALRTEGTLSVALTQDDARRLKQVFMLQQKMGVRSAWLDRDAALALEPHLNPRLCGAILVDADHQVDNRLVAAALTQAFLQAGGILYEAVGETGIDVEGDRAIGVLVQGRRHRADRVIVAAGAWSRQVPGLPAAACPPVRPVKGQMLALAMDADAPLLRHVLWGPKAYLVPRRDGRLIVGATTEEKGFDDTLTAGGMLALLEAAWRTLPGIEDLPVAETWVGLRPGSRDDAPILGETPIEGLLFATGHHRNGILLAPITASAIAALVLTDRTDPAIAPFSIRRFDKTTAGDAIAAEHRTSSWISA